MRMSRCWAKASPVRSEAKAIESVALVVREATELVVLREATSVLDMEQQDEMTVHQKCRKQSAQT